MIFRKGIASLLTLVTLCCTTAKKPEIVQTSTNFYEQSTESTQHSETVSLHFPADNTMTDSDEKKSDNHHKKNNSVQQEFSFPEFIVKPNHSKEHTTLEKKVAGIEVLDVDLVSSSSQNQIADNSAKYIRKNDSLTLYAVIKANTPDGIFYFTNASHIRFHGVKIPDAKIKYWKNSLEPIIEWYKIEADSLGLWYVRGSGIRCPDGKKECRDVDYDETYWNEGWTNEADVHPTILQDRFKDIKSGLGTMRYKIVVVYGGKEFSTFGKEEVKKHPVKIPRVSVREDTNSWTDYLYEMMNEPYIWGADSAADRIEGADCADLVVYGWRRAGHNQKYTWSKGLPSFTNPISKINLVLTTDSQYVDTAGRRIPVGNDERSVHKGDILLWDRHAAVFLSDNGDGYLGKDDRMIQTLFEEPHVESIQNGPGVPHEVRRWK